MLMQCAFISPIFADLMYFVVGPLRNGYDCYRTVGHGNWPTTLCCRIHIKTRHRKATRHFKRTKKYAPFAILDIYYMMH